MRIIWGILAIALGILTVGSAAALQYRALSLEQLVDDSGMVVVGSVIDVDHAAGVKSGLKEPRTTVRIKIRETWLGDPNVTEVTLTLPEGQLGDGTFLQVAEGVMPVPGESYLMFIKRRAWRISPFSGFHSGLWKKISVGKKSVFVDRAGRPIVELDQAGFQVGLPVSLPEDRVGATEFRTVSVAKGPGRKLYEQLSDDDVLQARAEVALATDAIRERVRQKIAEVGADLESRNVITSPEGASLLHEITQEKK